MSEKGFISDAIRSTQSKSDVSGTGENKSGLGQNKTRLGQVRRNFYGSHDDLLMGNERSNVKSGTGFNESRKQQNGAMVKSGIGFNDEAYNTTKIKSGMGSNDPRQGAGVKSGTKQSGGRIRN